MLFSFLCLTLSLFLDSVIADNAMLGNKVSAAWYAGWHSQDFPLSQVSWSKYTHLIYAFATTTPDVNTLAVADSDAALLPKFVSLAHQNGVKAMLSVGGWGGSLWYSTNVGSAENRTAFVKTVTDLVTKYNLDGIDFDWEYPAKQGTGCNTISPNDTSNFLSFLQQLRSSPAGTNLTLTAATSLTPWNDTTLNPSKDVSGFAQVLDWIEIMNYDIWTYEASVEAVQAGVGTLVGPTAPLNDTCEGAKPGVGSAASAINAWTQAGFPASQLVLGVPSYGHAFIVPKHSAYQNSSSSGGGSGVLTSYPQFTPQSPTNHHGDKWDDVSSGGPDICGVQQGLPPTGVYNFFGLVDAGFLNADGSVKDGVGYRFDDCSQTPYVYNPTLETMVSFDNAQSFGAKGTFIGINSLKGFAMWEAGGDHNDILLDSILSAMITSSSSQSQGKDKQSGSNSDGSGSGRRIVIGVRWVSLSVVVMMMGLLI